MLLIPFEIQQGHERGPLIVVVVLEKDNLDRMRQADPVDLHFSDYESVMAVHHRVRSLDLVIAYEEDRDLLLKFKSDNDISGLLEFLERGRQILPGDVRPPVKL